MTLVIWLECVLLVVLTVSLVRIHRVGELHHGYWGIALATLAVVFHWPLWLAWAGVVLLFDDCVQHVAEALGLVPRMADFTPIHKLGAYLMALNLKQSGWLVPILAIAAMLAAAIYFSLHGF